MSEEYLPAGSFRDAAGRLRGADGKFISKAQLEALRRAWEAGQRSGAYGSGRSLAEAIRRAGSVEGLQIDLGIQGTEAREPKSYSTSPGLEAVSDDVTLVEVAHALEFGSPVNGVPEYAPYRIAADAEGPRWLRFFGKTLGRYARDGDASVLEGQLRQLGVAMVSDMRDTIDEIDIPPNSQMTIDRKGSDNPMIDTGQFVNSQRASVTVPGSPPFLVG